MSSPAAKRIRREYGLTMLATAAGAGLLLAASGQEWASGLLEVPGPVASAPVEVTGSDLTGVFGGVGWAALAAIVGLYAARGRARRLIGMLIAVGGALALQAVWDSTRPDALVSAVSEHATDATGAGQATADPQLLAFGPVVAVAGAVLLLLTGIAAVIRAPVWPGMGTRYDRVAAPPPHRVETPSDMWKSLDAGDDPTLDTPAADGAPPDDSGQATGTADEANAPASLAARPAEPKEKNP